MVWQGGSPVIGPVYSPRLVERLGPARAPDDPIDDRHRNIAASMQAMYEEAFFAMVNRLQTVTGNKRLCVAGGCGYNNGANRMVFGRSGFRGPYIPATACEAGRAVRPAHLGRDR